MKTVEQMKKKGNFDKNELAKLGLDIHVGGDENGSMQDDGQSQFDTQGCISSTNRDLESVKKQ